MHTVGAVAPWLILQMPYRGCVGGTESTAVGVDDVTNQKLGLAFSSVLGSVFEPQFSPGVYCSYFPMALELVRINHM